MAARVGGSRGLGTRIPRLPGRRGQREGDGDARGGAAVPGEGVAGEAFTTTLSTSSGGAAGAGTGGEGLTTTDSVRSGSRGSPPGLAACRTAPANLSGCTIAAICAAGRCRKSRNGLGYTAIQA